jgi:DNA-binding PadR family transcriptional regulator
MVAGGVFILDLALKYLPALEKNTWPQNGGIDPTGLALLALAILPWIAAHLSSARLPGGIALAFREVEWRQDLTERAIRQLRFIVDGFLTRFEYQHLVNIHEGQEYGVREEDSNALTAELRRLMALGLIVKISDDHGVRDFTRADGKKRRIEKWFRLTPRGDEYLRMRMDNERDAAAGVESATVTSASSLPEKSAVLDRTEN